MRELVKERDIYKRERMVNLRLSSYLFSKVWIAFLLAVYMAACFTAIRYLAFDMPGGKEEMVFFFITEFLLVVAGTMMGLFSSALAPFQPLSFLTPLITKFMPRKGMPPKFVDPAMEEFHGNYPWIPIESVTELFEYQKVIRKKLPQIDEPFLLLASRNESTVSPEAVEMILGR